MDRKAGVRNRAASFRIEIPRDDGRKAEFLEKNAISTESSI